MLSCVANLGKSPRLFYPYNRAVRALDLWISEIDALFSGHGLLPPLICDFKLVIELNLLFKRKKNILGYAPCTEILQPQLHFDQLNQLVYLHLLSFASSVARNIEMSYLRVELVSVVGV